MHTKIFLFSPSLLFISFIILLGCAPLRKIKRETNSPSILIFPDSDGFDIRDSVWVIHWKYNLE